MVHVLFATQVVEDEMGLDGGHAGFRGDLLGHEVAQLFSGGARDVDHEVVRRTYDEQRNYGGKERELAGVCQEIGGGRGAQSHHDHGLEGQPEKIHVESGVK